MSAGHGLGAEVVRLRHWALAGRDVDFDRKSGQASLVPLDRRRQESDPVCGFAASERPIRGPAQWFAVYRSEASIHLQAGARCWILCDGRVELRHSRWIPFLSRFTIRVDGRLEHSIRYRHLGRFLAAIADPTYDKMDQDADFFLEFLAETVNRPSWCETVLNQWVSVTPRAS